MGDLFLLFLIILMFAVCLSDGLSCQDCVCIFLKLYAERLHIISFLGKMI